ncbi:MAG: HAD family phosphatase [Oscillospiraceae bacterium]|nr:HAD family phosphatase [Oscillospiraceae bacterium]
MKNIKGVIFDFDGTLLDSMNVWYHFEIEYLKSLGAEARPGLAEVLRSLSSIEEAIYFQEEYGVTKSVDEIISGRNKLIGEKYRNSIPLKPGALEVLETLHKQGKKITIATATERELIGPAVDRLELPKYVDRVFTCEEVGVSKSSPDIFIQAAEHMGTAINETLVVEDALYAVKTAKKAGFIVAGIYDASSEDHKEEIQRLSDYYWMDFEEMKDNII